MRASAPSWPAAGLRRGTSWRWQRTAGRRTGLTGTAGRPARPARTTLRTPSGDRGTAQRRGHRPRGRRPRPVGLCPDRGHTDRHAAPPRTDDQPHDTTGSTRPHRGRRPRRTDRPGSRLVRRTRPVRRGGRVGLGTRRRRIRAQTTVRRRPRRGALSAGDPARRHRRAPVRPRASTLAMASTCAAPAAGSMPARTCAPRSKCSKTLRPRGGPLAPNKSCGPPAKPPAAATSLSRLSSPPKNGKSPR